MKQILLAGLLTLALPTISAKQHVELSDIVKGKYAEKGMAALSPMQDGSHYLQLDQEQTMIIKYSYRTGAVVDTLFNAATARECPFDSFSGYTMSPDETKILLYTDEQSIYRHSFAATYYTYEIKRNLVKPLSDGGKQQVPTFSPDGRNVAFVRDNNIYLKRLDFDTESPVTTDGAKDSIINGIPDWVYEEEFALLRSLAWSGDSERIAFVKYNETQVPVYTMQLFEGMKPTYEEYAKYPGEFRYKYPVAGEVNANVGVYVYNISTRATHQMDVPLDEDGYRPDIRFTEEDNTLAVFTMNRHQNRLAIYTVNVKSGVSRLLLQDQNDTWIDPAVLDFITFYPDFFVFASEKSGYMHLYQYANSGTLIRPLTKGNWDVTAYLGYQAKGNYHFYQAAAESPLRREIYRVDRKGNTVKLSTQEGTNFALFNPTCSYYVHSYRSATTPLTITVNDFNGKPLRTIQSNDTLRLALDKIEVAQKEFFTFENEAGQQLNAWIMKPLDYDPTKQYPVVMLQYSGPGSQKVVDSWRFGWEQYLAANGFVVASADGRGTGARGTEFSRCIYMQMGYLEAIDQIAFATHLGTLPFVSKENIAIWGWSFGGYNTLHAMSMSDVFKAGVAIAPVTDWRYYDTIYTERYMRTPNENKEGYDKTSPLLKASDLSGNLLLISGTADDNVHPQNSSQYNEALVQANIQFDTHYYTNRNHSIRGGNTRLHLYTKVVNFLKQQLQ